MPSDFPFGEANKQRDNWSLHKAAIALAYFKKVPFFVRTVLAQYLMSLKPLLAQPALTDVASCYARLLNGLRLLQCLCRLCR
jgi:hypothetical protein